MGALHLSGMEKMANAVINAGSTLMIGISDRSGTFGRASITFTIMQFTTDTLINGKIGHGRVRKNSSSRTGAKKQCGSGTSTHYSITARNGTYIERAFWILF